MRAPAPTLALLRELRTLKDLSMKTWLMALLVTGLAGTLIPTDADARRLGGGRPAGMQRAAPDKPAQPAQTPATPAATPNNAGAPATAAAPATTGAAAAAAAPKRSWMGPIAGLAAGLGLAALFSHLGWGEGLANFVMLALLAIIAVVAVRWVMRRFAGNGNRAATPFAMAGAGAGSGSSMPTPATAARTMLPPEPASPRIAALPAAGALQTAQPSLPADFDAAAFERIAKMIFIRLQAANDKSDVNDLRAFTTQELFSSLRLDLQDRGGASQQTDVVTLNADLLDFAQENEQQIVSVHFSGLIREEATAGAQPFDEVWHLVRPTSDSRSWAIAGIQPRH
ncbi:MAG TPA: TIM44-like domain-containing protein [Burkholderiaceae bacterium]|nr:TIM44-like domain-containing protein [Burkholderiaceae bacterium]